MAPATSFLLVVLVGLLGLLRPSEGKDVRFVVMPGTGRQTVGSYQQLGRKMTPMQLDFSGITLSANSSGSLFLSQGAIHHLGPMQSAATNTQTLSLGITAFNGLWARWRYARLTNMSLVLTNGPPLLTPARANIVSSLGFRDAKVGLVSFACVAGTAPIPGVFCGAGQYTLAGSNKSLWVQLTPNATRSSLPPWLYHRLLRQSKTCVLLVPAGTGGTGSTLTLCGGPRLPYFDVNVAQDTISLGSSFLGANFSAMEVDGWTGTVTVQTVDAGYAMTAFVFQWLSVVSASVMIIILFGRQVSGPQSLAMQRFLYHTVVRRRFYWTMDYRSTFGSAFIALGAYGSGLPPSFDNTAAYGTGLDFLLLQILFTVYVIVQLILHVAVFVFVELSASGPLPGVRPFPMNSWIYDRRPIDPAWAWARHLLMDTTSLGAGILALLPIAANGQTAGSPFILFVLIPPCVALVFWQTYYASGIMLISLSTSVWSAPMSFYFFAVWQVIVSLAFFGALIAAVIGPLIITASSFFGTAYGFAAAVGLVGLGMVAAAALSGSEIHRVCHVYMDKVKKALVERKEKRRLMPRPPPVPKTLKDM